MKTMQHVLVALAAGTPLAGAAQGIPVIDTANLAQSVQQVVHDITKISNQLQQIAQLRAQLDGMTGSRLLGTVLDDPALRNYLPADAGRRIADVERIGYDGLGAAARALRDAQRLYNCEDRTGEQRARCQAELALPYQTKEMLQRAMASASGRLGQIGRLMQRVDATTDQKSVLEMQARIGAENALLAHEASRVQLLQALAQNEDRIAQSRDRERQQESLTRPGRIADHLH